MTKTTPRKAVIEVANEGRSGFSFELDEIQHAYEAQFGRRIAEIAHADGKDIVITDFGCGNGAMATGIIKEIKSTNYNGHISYTGLDIDAVGLNSAKERFGNQPDIADVVNLQVLDLKNMGAFEQGLIGQQNLRGLHVLLFCDSLHWLQPQEISDILTTVYQRTQEGTQVLATCCSVYNTTSIGTSDCPRQSSNINKVLSALSQEDQQPLGRSANQIEYRVSMTHFTPRSLAKMFSDAGFVVEDCSWCNNVLFPNGIEDLPENVKLTAFKQRDMM